MKNNCNVSMRQWVQTSILISFIFAAICVQAQTDLEIFSERMFEYVLEGADGAGADDYLATMQTNGSWSGIEYSVEVNSAARDFPAIPHVENLRTMAEAYSLPSHPSYQDADMLNGIILGLEYWYQLNLVSDNWWWNTIGKPQRLGPIGILLKEVLPSNLLQEIEGDLLSRYPSGMEANVGANRYWYADVAVMGAVLSGDESILWVCRDYYTSELKINELKDGVTAAGGIKPDYGWWQHGNSLLIGAYGFSAVQSVGIKAKLFNGLSYAFDQEDLDVLADYIHYGTQWFVRRDKMDVSSKDRAHTRPDGTLISQDSINALGALSVADPSNASLYDNLLDHIAGNNDASCVGNRHFWYGDFQSHRRAGYMIGLKVLSNRTKNGSPTNTENLKGEFLNYGTCLIYKDGDEYTNIFPTWDYARIPGGTSRHDLNPGTGGGEGSKAFVGGVSDGTYGAAVLDLDHREVTGKKAWFFFDEAFVALGAGITSSSSDEINTTLNQCHIDGDTYVETGSGMGSLTGTGVYSLTDPAWVHHDGVGYLFPTGGDVGLRLEQRIGDWYDINNLHSGMETNDVFTLYLNHGVAPSSESYYYVIMPDATRAEVQAFAAAGEVSVAANSTAVQAVYHRGLSRGQAIFHEPGSVTLRSGCTVTVDAPCALMINESDPQNVLISASNPKNTALEVNVDTVMDGVSTTTVFRFSGDAYVGSTLTQAVGDETTDTIPMIQTTSLVGAVPDEPYSKTLSLIMGEAPYTWSIVDGTLPSGMTLGAADGVISGAPLSSGDYEFTVQVEDSDGDTDLQLISLFVETPPNGNQVLNGSFEDGGTSPLFWNLGSTAVGSTNDASHGSSSLLINQTSTPTTQSVATEIGREYELSVWVNAAGHIADNVVFDTNDRYDSTCQFTINSKNMANGWTKFSGSFTATNTAVNLRIFATSSSYEGEVYFDNVVLVTAPEAPVITSTPELLAVESVEYTYTLTATDANDDPLTYTAPILPSWLTFTNQVLSGTPGSSDLGIHNVTLSVSDGTFSTNQVFTITASNPGFDIVPNVSGQDQATAETNMINAGFVVGSVTTGYTRFAMSGNVVATDPAAGQSVPVGSSVDLEIMEAEAAASTMYWASNGGSSDWAADANWSNSEAPMRETQNFKVQFKNDSQECILTNSATVSTLVMGDGGTTHSYLRLKPGADLYAGLKPNGAGSNWTAIGYSQASTLTVETNAVFATHRDLLLARTGGDSFLIIDGGTVDIMTVIAIGSSDQLSSGFVTIDGGGVLTASGLIMNSTNSVIDVRNGTIILDGNDTTAVNGWVSQGILGGYGGAGTLNVDYDQTHSGKTTITATSPTGGYDVWAVTKGYIEGPLGDDNDDGFNNLSEYAVSEKPVLTKAADAFTYVYKQRNDDPNLSVELQTCTDLVAGSWTNTGYTIHGTNITGETYDEVTNSIPIDGSQSYVRLKVTNP